MKKKKVFKSIWAPSKTRTRSASSPSASSSSSSSVPILASPSSVVITKVVIIVITTTLSVVGAAETVQLLGTSEALPFERICRFIFQLRGIVPLSVVPETKKKDAEADYEV